MNRTMVPFLPLGPRTRRLALFATPFLATAWFKTAVASPCSVEGDSMAPALCPDYNETGREDHVVVWHWASTRTLRNTEADIAVQTRMDARRKSKGQSPSPWNAHDVRRGDVVAFWSPGGNDRMSVKRVIALGGDEVVVQGRELHGDKYRFNDGSKTSNSKMAASQLAKPTMGLEISAQSQDRTVVVPYGYCWVEGDNAEHSLDSREYGPVCLIEGLWMRTLADQHKIPLPIITGKVLGIIWPFNRMGGISRDISATSSKVIRGIAVRPEAYNP
jgi:signal peptidase I